MCERIRMLIGCIAIIISIILISFWAWWGILENFHEGWYLNKFWKNMCLTIAYLSPSLIFIALSLLALRCPKIGGYIYMLAGILLMAWWGYERWPISFSDCIHVVTLSGCFLLIMGIMFYLTKSNSFKAAYYLIIFIPMLIVLVFGAEPVWRICFRVDDGLRTARSIRGNGVELFWAPSGPGWPIKGNVNYVEAKHIVSHLDESGQNVLDSPQDFWRLPTADEMARSMTRYGKNAVGTWDANQLKARYKSTPDKETPLWNPTSSIIYWWTSSTNSKDTNKAYVACYNGKIFLRAKKLKMGSLGFRAVRCGTDTKKGNDSF